MEGDPDKTHWEALSAARGAAGYSSKVQPARALPGSPQPILAVGLMPDWLTDYGYAESFDDHEALQRALSYALDDHSPEEVGQRYAELLSHWMDADVTYAGEEEHDTGVQFS